jgi:hypothetical protein
MENTEPRKPSSEALQRGYEDTQPSLRGMLLFLLGFVACAVVLHFILGWMYVALVDHAPATLGSPLAPPPQSQGAQTTGQVGPLAQGPLIPPPPRLQPSGARNESPLEHLDAPDMARFRQQQDALLNSYAIDALTGDLTIPIDDAMQLVARDIPTHPSTQPNQLQPQRGHR